MEDRAQQSQQIKDDVEIFGRSAEKHTMNISFLGYKFLYDGGSGLALTYGDLRSPGYFSMSLICLPV